MKKDTAAIIVAGGQGLRYGAALPPGRRRIRKQYLALCGRPILWWSLSAFDRSPSIRQLVLVVPREDVDRIRRQSRAWRLKKPFWVTAGGATRTDSVRRGLEAVAEDCRYVAVHDAVRPLVTPKVIENVLRAARRSKAALAACPSRDTVKLANGSRIVKSTPRRETVWLAQTPQVFERKLLEKAHAGHGHYQATDDAQLVERLGIKVKLVEAPAENIKVTHPIDLEIARMILNRRGGPGARPEMAIRSPSLSGRHKAGPYR